MPGMDDSDVTVLFRIGKNPHANSLGNPSIYCKARWTWSENLFCLASLVRLSFLPVSWYS